MPIINQPNRTQLGTNLRADVVTSKQAVVATQSVTVAAPALGVGFGPRQTQAHGVINQAAIKGFQAAIEREPLTVVADMAPRQGGIPRPWEDVRSVAVKAADAPTITAKQLGDAWLFEDRKGTLDKILSDWSSTTHAEMWTTPIGKGVAAFAVSRYGQASLQFDQRGKLQHVVEVLNNADRVTLDQASLGEKLDPQWRGYLEYAALLHDIGYMNGGFMHPKKGGNDMMYHLRTELEKHGVDGSTLSDVDIEKMALIVELHGDSFPWGQIGDDADKKRLAGTGGFGDFPYLSLGLVDQTFAKPGRTEQFIDIMRKENEVYIAERGGLSWLNDPAQVRELIRTGYVMHAADKYKGPSANQIETRAGTKPGVSAPLTTFAAADEFLRVQDVNRTIGGLSRATNGLLNQILNQAPAAQRNVLQQKVMVDLEDSLAGIAALIGNVTKTLGPQASNDQVAASLAEVGNCRFVRELDVVVNRMLPDAVVLVQTMVEGAGASSLRALVEGAIKSAAQHLSPDRKRLDAAAEQIGSLRSDVAGIFNDIVDGAPRDQRAVIQQKVMPALEDALDTISALIGNVIQKHPSATNAELAQALRDITQSFVARDLDAIVGSMPAAAEELVSYKISFDSKANTLGQFVANKINATADQLSSS
jgi:hypothetical protein